MGREYAQFPANEDYRDQSPAQEKKKTSCGFEVAILVNGSHNWPFYETTLMGGS